MNIGPIERNGGVVEVRDRAVPLMLCSAVLPLAYGPVRAADVRRRRRWARDPTGSRNCGCDRRATPTRCPEWVAVPSAGEAASGGTKMLHVRTGPQANDDN